jgi:hypothetical protein
MRARRRAQLGSRSDDRLRDMRVYLDMVPDLASLTRATLAIEADKRHRG